MRQALAPLLKLPSCIIRHEFLFNLLHTHGLLLCSMFPFHPARMILGVSSPSLDYRISLSFIPQPCPLCSLLPITVITLLSSVYPTCFGHLFKVKPSSISVIRLTFRAYIGCLGCIIIHN